MNKKHKMTIEIINSSQTAYLSSSRLSDCDVLGSIYMKHWSGIKSQTFSKLFDFFVVVGGGLKVSCLSIRNITVQYAYIIFIKIIEIIKID